jgi:tripartite-type tricarboxylate transporter receptor subunit TctC
LLLANPEVTKRLSQLGLEVAGGSPADFDRFMKQEAGRLDRLIKAGAVKAE